MTDTTPKTPDEMSDDENLTTPETRDVESDEFDGADYTRADEDARLTDDNTGGAEGDLSQS